jgi:predicted dehydrogenase
MHSANHPTRRRFLGTTAKTAATLAATTLPRGLRAATSPNASIGVGCIGLGTRGGDLIKNVTAVAGVKVVAVCDVFQPHLQKGLERSANPEAKGYLDYRELLADPRVDAVVIGTPDHWHCQMVLDAVAAGKDIYCEKGFSHTLEEAKRMRDAIKRSKVVFQLGHQGRQSTAARQAKELLAAGILGPVTLVRTGRFMSCSLEHPTWRWYGYYNQRQRPDPAEVAKQLDWERWLGPAPRIPWNERHFWHWRCYWAYGTGQAGDLLSHELDMVQYVLGHGIPDTCNCSGLNARLKDDREVPDTWIATYQFESLGRSVNFIGSMNTRGGQPVEICGANATLRFNDIGQSVSNFEIIPEHHYDGDELPAGYQPRNTPSQPSHMQDFFNCMRDRGTPKCPADEAFIESATFLMSVESYRQGRLVRWDPAREEIV